MTFTYTPSSTPSDATLVRFHTGQTVEAESFLSDEEISMILAQEGTWQKAVIAGIKFIMARLSQPNFKADWLQVDNKAARDGFEKLLAEKRHELGVAAVTATVVNTYRVDSLATEEPTYQHTSD